MNRTRGGYGPAALLESFTAPRPGAVMVAELNTARSRSRERRTPWGSVELVKSLVRDRSTSPGRIRSAAMLLAAALVVLAAVEFTAIRGRHQVADTLADSSEPSLVHAARLYVALADADATPSPPFVTGGIETPAQRQRYLSDLATAASELSALLRTSAGDAAVAADLDVVSESLPTYAGLVETARADRAQGFPTGAAYLRAASEELSTITLPAVLSVYRTEAARNQAAYRRGMAPAVSWRLVLAMISFVILAIAVQVWLARRTHRLFNPALLAATLVGAAVAMLCLLVLVQTLDSLNAARRHGSDVLTEMSSAHILAARMRTDEILDLTGGQFDHTYYRGDFAQAAGRLTDSGMLDDAPAPLKSELAGYLQAHQRVNELEDELRLSDAVQLAAGLSRDPSLAAPATTLFGTFVSDVDHRASVGQAQFESHVARARAAGQSYLIIPAGLVLGLALVAIGVRPRLEEYR